MDFHDKLPKNISNEDSSAVIVSEPSENRKTNKNKKETEEENFLSQDKDDESSSSASTVLSESTPHWADFLELDPWADDLKPSFKLLECEDLTFDQNEEEGNLNDHIIEGGLSFLSPCPFLHNYSQNKLQLSGKKISNIDKLADYKYLQYIDLSKNNLKNISSLENLPFLMYLDVSYNKLAFVLQFSAPLNLTYVNFSHNEVSFIDDLTDFWSLMKLDLSHNNISRIEGLQNLRYLQVLDLSFNKIQRFENLNYLHLTHLYLQNNKISEFEEGEEYGTKNLQCLQCINLDYNELKSLALFEDSSSLQNVSLIGNHIAEIFDIENLKASKSLRELNFQENPLTEWPEYRRMVISTVPSLVVLDGIPVTWDEKVSAKNTFDPDARFVAARSHSLLIIMEQLNNPTIDSYIFPLDQQPLPIVILVGPVASEKGSLVRYIAEKFPHKVSLGVCHTSRPKSLHEIDGYHYHFVNRDEMNKLLYSGSFVAFTEILGEFVGLDRAELFKAFQKKCLCITHLDLIGATAIYNRGLKPHLVLTISQSEEINLQRLSSKSYISQHCRQEECQKKTHKDELSQNSTEPIESLFTNSFLKNNTESYEKRLCQCQLEETVSTNESMAQEECTLEEEKILQIPKETIKHIKSLISSHLQTAGEASEVQQTSIQLDVELMSQRSTNEKEYITIGYKSKRTMLNSLLVTIMGEKRADSLPAEIVNNIKSILTDSKYVKLPENIYKPQKIKSCPECNYVDISIRSTIESREAYFKVFSQNKEFFSSVIYTDNFTEACQLLCKTVKEVYQTTPKKPIFSLNHEKFQASIPDRLNFYLSEIDKHHNICEKEKIIPQDCLK